MRKRSIGSGGSQAWATYREAERKDNRNGEGKESGKRGAEEKRKRLTHTALAPDRILPPGSNMTAPSPQRNTHLYSILFKIKSTKIKTECENKYRNGEIAR